MKKKTYRVALQFVEYEVGEIEAKNKKEALEKARQEYEDGLWDGTFDDRQHNPKGDYILRKERIYETEV
jgi:hypothetical protein